MTITEQELKPCQRCGGKPTVKVYECADMYYGGHDVDVNIDCFNKECIELYEEDPFDWWNTRAYDTELEELRRVKREHAKLVKITNNICEFYNKMQTDINNYNICVNSFDLKTMEHFFKDFKDALIKGFEEKEPEELLK
jgi:hypothetical protein